MTVSVPLSAKLAAKVDEMVENGEAANKADLLRKALERYLEDEAVRAVLDAAKEPSLEGDLDILAKKLK